MVDIKNCDNEGVSNSEHGTLQLITNINNRSTTEKEKQKKVF